LVEKVTASQGMESGMGRHGDGVMGRKEMRAEDKGDREMRR
jgi:hypothetical protein